MAVSDRDRAYFARIGAAKAESHSRATEEHLALSLDERLSRSWELYLRMRHSVDLTLRHDDPSPFYARARALGLYCD